MAFATAIPVSCSSLEPDASRSPQKIEMATLGYTNYEEANLSAGDTEDTEETPLTSEQISALLQQYADATVCGALFGETSSNWVLGEAAVTDSRTTGTLTGCYEGPQALPSIEDAHLQYRSVLDTAESGKTACISNPIDLGDRVEIGFWDPRDVEGGCETVAASAYGFDCSYEKVRSLTADISGLDDLLAGYQQLGWSLEQCIFK